MDASPDRRTDFVVFAGGDAVHPRWHDAVSDGRRVIAADSGLEHVVALGLVAEVVVGDMDSVDPAVLDNAQRGGTRVERFAVAKDATDLELALATAVRLGAIHVTLVGIGGGRLDHFLANALLLGAPEWAGLNLVAFVGSTRVTVIREYAELPGPEGSLVTLLPLHGRATGITTTGLRWALTDAELVPGSTRGVSNELISATATITVTDGVLLAIQPQQAEGD
ncbi:MAG: thiamine diphosphokinase [Acidimicrobiia bacterium]|nr:thiamine diphosphokinase [Acidimicrobiia bacterium]